MELDDQIPRHRKKKYSKSNSSKRSDHKHDYEKVIVKTWYDISWGDRCRICGRMSGRPAYCSTDYSLYTKCSSTDDRRHTSRLLGRTYRALSLSELQVKYPNTKIYESYMDYDENGKLIVELKYRLVTDKFTE